MLINENPPVACARPLVCVSVDKLLEQLAGRRTAPQLEPTVYWPRTPTRTRHG